MRHAALGFIEASSAAAAAIHSLCEWCAAPLAAQWPLVGQLYAAVQAQGGAAGPPPPPAAGHPAAGPAVAESDVQTVRFEPLTLTPERAICFAISAGVIICWSLLPHRGPVF